MNTLNIIKKQIQKAAATHDAQIHLTRYRGHDCKVHEGGDRRTRYVLLSRSLLH